MPSVFVRESERLLEIDVFASSINGKGRLSSFLSNLFADTWAMIPPHTILLFVSLWSNHWEFLSRPNRMYCKWIIELISVMVNFDWFELFMVAFDWLVTWTFGFIFFFFSSMCKWIVYFIQIISPVNMK